MNYKLEQLSAAEIGQLVNSKKIKPIDVVKYFENRICKYNDLIGGFIYTEFEYAEQEAEKLQARLDAGEYIGPFAGVPFGLKEFLPNKPGWKSWHGGVACLESIDDTQSVFCEAMEKAGGIAIGKCNAPSYGFRGTTYNKMFGNTSTPFNLAYNSGGSSGGSAASVASGIVPIAEGGDAGGSIRVPASFCGLFGFKAGVGTIPSVCRPDAWAATHPLCFNGGLTKTVTDAAILLNYMAYHNPRDPYSLPRDIDYVTEMKKSVSGLKIAYTSNFDLFDVEPEVIDKVKKAAFRFKELGATVEEVHFKFKHTAGQLSEQWCKGITIDCALELNHAKQAGNDLLSKYKEDFPEEFIYWKEQCDKLTIEDMYKFNLARTDILDQFENIFDNYDLIISPISCVVGIKNTVNTKGPEILNGKPVDGLIGWAQTFLANFTGNPAASVPVGLSHDNIPIGMQLIGKRHHDADVLKFAYSFEQLQPWKDSYERIIEENLC